MKVHRTWSDGTAVNTPFMDNKGPSWGVRGLLNFVPDITTRELHFTATVSSTILSRVLVQCTHIQ